MKQIFKFIMPLLALVLVFSSCSKDDDKSAMESAIIGTWQLTEVKLSEKYIAWPFKETIASFRDDGTYYGSGYWGTGTGTYTVSGSTVTCYISGNVYASYEVLNFTSTEAEMKITVRGSSYYIKCKKN